MVHALLQNRTFYAVSLYGIDSGVILKKEPIQCDNIFCFHHGSMNKNLSSWNKTQCSFYEIDPYDKKNPEGFKVEDCEARKKYKRYGW